ncbi:MAG: hypothetical protein ACLS9K_16135 [Lachnospira eligens]
MLKSDSKASDGSGVNFVYISKTKVGNNEMYIIRYDVIKGGSTTTAGLYGVDTSSGKIYFIGTEELFCQRILRLIVRNALHNITF